jgi:isopentenyl diphosphate isomerase/L-lactate dehydrogenase-like FMN-dependent dehydrogenase
VHVELIRVLEEKARGVLPASVYDYYAGGAGEEQTLAENVRRGARSGCARAASSTSRRRSGDRGARALDEDLRIALALLGCSTPGDVGAQHARLAGW